MHLISIILFNDHRKGETANITKLLANFRYGHHLLTFCTLNQEDLAPPPKQRHSNLVSSPRRESTCSQLPATLRLHSKLTRPTAPSTVAPLHSSQARPVLTVHRRLTQSTLGGDAQGVGTAVPVQHSPGWEVVMWAGEHGGAVF